MANRILRDWTDSENVDKLSFQAEVLFTRLFMKADDYGCFHANPKLVKAAVFPLKDIREADISRWLDECQKAGLIAFYNEGGKKYLCIRNFGQRLRAMKRRFPEPADNSLTNDRDPLTIDGDLRSDDSDPRPETKRNETEVETESEKKLNYAEKVFLKKSEYLKLCKEFTQDASDRAISFLNDYKTEKGYKTRSDYLTIRRWVMDAVKKQTLASGLKNGQKSKIEGLLDVHEGEMEKIKNQYGINNNGQ